MTRRPGPPSDVEHTETTGVTGPVKAGQQGSERSAGLDSLDTEQGLAPVDDAADAADAAHTRHDKQNTIVGATAPSGAQQVLGHVIAPGARIGPFRVVRLLGHGGMGAVWLARDMTLGRHVALKLVRQDRMQERDAVDRFLREARATAAFNHPHIVSIYSVGEHEGVPYVALEYLEGETLRERMRAGPVAPREALRMALAMAEALVEAHRHGILHRDLKPENVLLPKDGRLRVVDFGLALRVDPDPPVNEGVEEDLTGARLHDDADESGFVLGTPGYMAPEQWQGLPSDKSDVWALGMVVAEMLLGARPLAALRGAALSREVLSPLPLPLPAWGADVPAGARDLVAACLQKDAARRPPADAVRDTLSALVTGPSTRPAGESPFLGLHAFSERDASMFFGRDGDVDAFLALIRENAVLPIVGPSGAGKSSFVQAGVLPRLRELSPWSVIRMRPGAYPFSTLAARLLRSDDTASGSSPLETTKPAPSAPPGMDRGQLSTWLAENPNALGLFLADRVERMGAPVVLIVDALEELATHVDDEDTRARFMEAICTAAIDPAEPVRVVFTVRDDFLGRIATGPAARDALGHAFVLRSPGEAALRDILVRPLEAAQHAWEPGVVEAMLAEVRGEAACLPLLQFAGTMLWERRDAVNRRLTMAAYEAIGGVGGALATHADGVLSALPPDHVKLAREMLLRLVTPEETRRPLSRGALVEGLPPESVTDANAVLDRFVDARLLAVRRSRSDEGRGDLELAHESLITRWDTLARWLDESREERVVLGEVRASAELWRKRGARVDDAWQGDALHDARRVLSRAGKLPDVVDEFLAAGVERERLAVRRRRLWASAAAFVLLLITVGSLVATAAIRGEKLRAEAERSVALQKRAEAERAGAAAALSRGDALEARARLRASLEIEDNAVGRALWRDARAESREWSMQLGGMTLTGVSPSGARVAFGRQDGSVLVVDAVTLETRLLEGPPNGKILAPRFPTEERVVGIMFVDGNYHVRTWDLADPSRAPGDVLIPGGRCGRLADDGSLVAVCRGDGVELVNPSTGRVERTVSMPHASGVVVPMGARFIATGSGEHLRVTELATERALLVMPTPPGARHFALTPDGGVLAIGDVSGRIELVRTDGRPPSVLEGHSANVLGMIFDASGRTLVSTGEDGVVRVFDVVSGKERTAVRGYADTNVAMNISADGRLLATSSYFKGDARIFSLAATTPKEPAGHTGTILGVDMAPDGSAVSAGEDGRVLRWESATGRSTTIAAPDVHLLGVDVAADGRTVAVSSSSGVAFVLDAVTGRTLTTLSGHRGWVWDAVISPRGDRIVSAGQDGTLRVWSASTGALERTISVTPGPLFSISWPGEGTLLAASDGSRGIVHVFDTATWKPAAALQAHRGMSGADLRVDHKAVVAGVDEGAVILDVDTGESRVLSQARSVQPMWSLDGARVGAPGSEGVVRVWDVATGASVPLVGHAPGADVNAFIFSPDGNTAVTAGDDGTVRLWDANTGAPAWHVDAVVPRPVRMLSHRGWERLDEKGDVVADDSSAWWRGAVTTHARRAASDDNASRLCVETKGGALELWDLEKDARVSSWPAEHLAEMSPWSGGCAGLDDGDLVAVTPAGRRSLASRAPAYAVVGGELLAIVDEGVAVFDASGNRARTLPAPPSSVAVGKVGGDVVVGTRQGDVVILGAAGVRPLTTTGLPARPVTRVVEGPAKLVVAGFDSGDVAVFDPASGARLATARVHGRVVHIVVDGASVHAISDLADSATLDLSVFHLDRCALLQDVWAAVPIVWEGGHPRRQDAPADHPCRSTPAIVR